MDLDDKISKIKDLVSTFFREDPPDLGISWTFNLDDVQCYDPFEQVIIEDTVILLRSDPYRNQYAFLEILKGYVAYMLRHSIHNNYSRWKLATIIALVLTPTTIITNSARSQYLRFWATKVKHLEPRYRKYNYYRWYNVISSYGRKSAIQILQEFIDELDNEKHLEVKLNQFFHQYLASSFTSDDLIFLDLALRNQTLEITQLQKISDFNSSKLYRLRNRMAFHLDEYILPNYQNLGLFQLYIESNDKDLLHYLRNHPYHEQTEIFKNSGNFLTKVLLPIDQLEFLANSYLGKQENTNILLGFHRNKMMILNPDLYDTKTKLWSHENQEEIEEIEIKFEHRLHPDRPSSDELELIQTMVMTGEDKFDYLSIHHSHTDVKNLLKQIDVKNYIQKKVLWRYPSDLETSTFYLGLEQELQLDPDDHLVTILDSIPSLWEVNPKFNELMYPVMIVDPVVKLSDSYRGAEFGYLVRIADSPTSMVDTLSRFQDYLIGVHLNNPGSSGTLPIEQYQDGIWNVDMRELMKKINKK